MFKYFLSVFGLLLAIAFSFMSCEKREHLDPVHEQWAQEIPNAKKTGTLFSIGIMCGHTISECGGNCLPPSIGGHADCQGAGKHCVMSANILVVPVGSSLYTATTQDSTDLTSEEFFTHPQFWLFLFHWIGPSFSPLGVFGQCCSLCPHHLPLFSVLG